MLGKLLKNQMLLFQFIFEIMCSYLGRVQISISGITTASLDDSTYFSWHAFHQFNYILETDSYPLFWKCSCQVTSRHVQYSRCKSWLRIRLLSIFKNLWWPLYVRVVGFIKITCNLYENARYRALDGNFLSPTMHVQQRKLQAFH